MKTFAMLAILTSCLLSANAEDLIPQGRLGHPLGTYLAVEGIRAKSGKVGTQTLLVDKVNGKLLGSPVPVWIDNVSSLPLKERCILKGYENGRMIGTPPGAIEAAKEAGRDTTVQQAAWQFRRFFVMTSSVEPPGWPHTQSRLSYAERVRQRRAVRIRNIEQDRSTVSFEGAPSKEP